MDSLTIFGAAAVTAILAFCALEPRGRELKLAFAGARVASSVSLFFARTCQFGMIPAVWAGVAARRSAAAKTGMAHARAGVP